MPAVFLDRDGTIIEDNGDLSDPSQVVFFEDTVSSLRRLSAYFALFIVTNQSGIAKGKITTQQVDLVNAYIVSHLQRHGIHIFASYVCPHKREDGCVCIKPNPFFIKKAALKFGIDTEQSFVIGDHPYDVEFAINAGAMAIYVLSGHGMKHRHELSKNTVIAAGIREATEIILKQVKPAQNIQRSLGLRLEGESK
jgi:D-glycero-D-manno-heptose 1,7-bisphosphate phosphatase